MNLIIQIVNYKTKKYLVGCIDSVINDLKNSVISYKVLILENNSGDDLSDFKDKYKKEAIEFHYSDKNLGFGSGHNFLAEKADSKYLFVLNPDTIVVKDTIRTLFDFMESHVEAGLCGPRIEEPHFFDHRIFWPRKFLIKYLFERFLKIKIFDSIKYLEHNPVLGSALFFRRESFNKIGGFDENLFLYFEEGDICNSLKIKGYKIFVVYDAVIKHFYYRSHRSEQNNDYFKKSEKYFFKKWPNGDIN